MSLREKYQAFLARPSADALADDASLHYITTLTSINGAAAIMKHFAAQEKMLKKKGDKVLSCLDGVNGLSLEVDTTIEFVFGGGAYLPGLDDNFLADRIVSFPLVHMVHFDQDQNISQIRLFWDQGSLLKQIDVIGARARNWPIRDGKEQARLIATSAATVPQSAGAASAASSRRSTASKGQDDARSTGRPASSRSTHSNAMNDPHATLNLFQARNMEEETASHSRPAAPRAQSAKPPPRDMSELFVGEDSGSPSPQKTASPQKQRIPTKAGGGKNYKPSRLFEEEEPEATPMSVKTNSKKYDHFEFGNGEEASKEPEATPMSVKTNAKKYDHFEFGHGDDEATPKGRDVSKPAIKTKHQSQWDFEDFVTPQKQKPKVLAQAVRHFGWSDDEEEATPAPRPIVHKARPDADPHFEFVDDGTPAADRKEIVSSKGRLHNKGLGLYKDHVLHSTSDDEEDNAHQGDVKRPLGDVTTAVKNENRKKDFGSQWEMTDDSPATQKVASTNNRDENNKHGVDRQRVLKGLDAHWGLYEDSPEQHKKENTDRGIKTTGNGMGGRKGTGRSWAIGDEDDEYKSGPQTKDNRAAATKSFWDF